MRHRMQYDDWGVNTPMLAASETTSAQELDECIGPRHRRTPAAFLHRALLLFLALACFSPTFARSQVKEVRRVLIFYELGLSSPGVERVDDGIRAALENSPYQIELYREYLETTLFPAPATQLEFREWYAHKYKDLKPDLLIAAGPSPLKFLADSHDRDFAGVPIVFCTTSEDLADRPNLDDDFTGVWEKFDASETLEEALVLQPATKHVFVVGGTSALDRLYEAAVKKDLDAYKSKVGSSVEIRYLTDLTMPELLKRLRSLPEHALVLLTDVAEDAAGTKFVGATQSTPMVVNASNAPVFSLSDVDLGHGEVGGDVISFTKEGEIAGDIALRILKGEKPKDIPIVPSANANMFDWRALHRWHLEEGKFPEGSIILNKPPNAWEANKRYVIFGILALLAQSMAIFALLWQRKKRKQIAAELVWRFKLESLLSELSTTFINLPEELIDREIERSMARLGEFLRMDSISLLEFSSDRKELGTICCWSTSGVSPASPVLKTDQMPWWKKRLLSGIVTHASGPDSLPEAAIAERRYFRQTGIASAASVPLEVGGEINGTISFVAVRHQRLWTDDLINQLRVAGEIFWSALKRKRVATALLRSQATLRESEERFRLVANTAPVMIWMSDPDKLCTYFNAGWLDFTGRSLEEEFGNGWAQGVHADDLQRCWTIYSESFDQRELFQMEYRLRRYDGEYRWIFDQGLPRFNADGTFAGYIGTCIDVTERKAAEEALSSIGRKLIEAHEEERTRIARELHDDFNQRITLLAVNLTGLRKGLPTRDSQFNHALQDAIEQVGELGHDMQALAHRLHSSKLEYLGLTAACAGVCRELSDRDQIRIEFHSEGVPKKLPQEIALCLFRILQEALQNAVKHSGVQDFQVSLVGGLYDIELTVQDSGVGFDFAEAIKGPGIGLTSMKERLKLVDGELLLDSQLQRGTKIHARVPLASNAVAAKAGA